MKRKFSLDVKNIAKHLTLAAQKTGLPTEFWEEELEAVKSPTRRILREIKTYAGWTAFFSKAGINFGYQATPPKKTTRKAA